MLHSRFATTVDVYICAHLHGSCPPKAETAFQRSRTLRQGDRGDETCRQNGSNLRSVSQYHDDTTHRRVTVTYPQPNRKVITLPSSSRLAPAFGNLSFRNLHDALSKRFHAFKRRLLRLVFHRRSRDHFSLAHASPPDKRSLGRYR